LSQLEELSVSVPIAFTKHKVQTEPYEAHAGQ